MDFNPKSGSIKFSGVSPTKELFFDFNPKSGSIKFFDSTHIVCLVPQFQSQKWFD